MIGNNKRAKLVTYLLLRKDKEVYLVRYKDSPNPKRSGWWIPAPELVYGEHPEDCAKRILKSFGIEDTPLNFAGIDSFVAKDWHMLFYYTADIDTTPTPDPEYERGIWFSLDMLPDPKEFAHGRWEKDLVLRLARVGR